MEEIKEECIVTDVKGSLAYIRKKKQDGCNGCKACIFSKSENIVVPAIMEIQCKKGDNVLVKLPKKEINFASLIIYILPLFFLILGFIVGFAFKNDIIQIIFAITLCVLSFIIIYFIDKAYRKKDYMPTIIKILKENENG